MNTALIWITPEAEKKILYIGRVSNPQNQENKNTGLIKYLIRNQHWSPFEMANACFEIETSRSITAQIVRHRSFSFQEFSQRYSKASGYEKYEARRQDKSNRQSSIDDLDEGTKEDFALAQEYLWNYANSLYCKALEDGIAKEQARFLLPMSTTSRLYMNGTIRSWMHYINLRTGNGTQKEHVDIAYSIRDQLVKELPVIAEALEWK